MTDPLGQSQVLPYLTGLTKLGYQFTLISFEKKERLAANGAIIKKICNENGICWHPLLYTSKPPILSTIKDLQKLKSAINKLHKETGFAIVHCRSYITALAGVWMKKKWNVKFVFDMRGFWADERVDGGIWNLRNPLFRMVYKYFKKKEKLFFSNADYSISLTHNAKQVIHSWNDINGQPIPIQVIPCCVDLSLFNPSSIEPASIDRLKSELQIPLTSQVISYIGSIGTWYMLPEMLQFFKRWLDTEPDSIFLFVTNEKPAHILEPSKAMGINEASIRIRQAARTEVPLFIAACNYSLFFIKPVFSKRASSPTKQGEIMAMGKPVVCNTNVGDTDHVLTQYHSGVLVNDFADEAFDKVIEAIRKPENFNSSAIRNGASQFFSLEEGVNRYAEVYRKVLHEE